MMNTMCTAAVLTWTLTNPDTDTDTGPRPNPDPNSDPSFIIQRNGNPARSPPLTIVVTQRTRLTLALTVVQCVPT